MTRANAGIGSVARVLRAAALALGLAGLPAWAGAADKPRRIVSINVCTDQLALMLAPPERIKSLSFLAADPPSSVMAEEAKKFPLNRGLAEEILPLNPDIVLAGPYSAVAAVTMLRRLGHRVFELPLGQTLDDVPRHIRAVARVLGEDARGEALIRDFEARMAAIPPVPPGPRPVAALYSPNGITAGTNSLPQSVMAAAGFDNLAARRGLEGVGYLTLERVVAARPDALIVGRLSVDYPSLAARSLDHPALAHAVPPGAMIALPHNLWACAIPRIADAVAALAALRRRLPPLGPRAGARP